MGVDFFFSLTSLARYISPHGKSGCGPCMGTHARFSKINLKLRCTLRSDLTHQTIVTFTRNNLRATTMHCRQQQSHTLGCETITLSEVWSRGALVLIVSPDQSLPCDKPVYCLRIKKMELVFFLFFFSPVGQLLLLGGSI